MSKDIKTGITIGDPSGIGPEVVVKSLENFKQPKDSAIYVFGDEVALIKNGFKKNKGKVIFVNLNIIKESEFKFGILSKKFGEASLAYFAFTDRGERVEVSDEAKPDFEELLSIHHWHSVTVEFWKQDFINGLLFPWDFWIHTDEVYPDAYIKHALEIYIQARGSLPIDEVSGCREQAIRLGIPLPQYKRPTEKTETD